MLDNYSDVNLRKKVQKILNKCEAINELSPIKYTLLKNVLVSKPHT